MIINFKCTHSPHFNRLNENLFQLINKLIFLSLLLYSLYSSSIMILFLICLNQNYLVLENHQEKIINVIILNYTQLFELKR